MSQPFSDAQRPTMAVPHAAYQVDFVAVNCGKIMAASKRRICFRFGYTNTDALSDEKTGQECRGSEHEVVVTWSLSSGKQAIAFDQEEIFFGVGDSTQTKFSRSWEDKFGHCLQVKIHAAPMSTKAAPNPNWKQYDLLIDGVSFFDTPKIFEIGVFPKDDAASSLSLGPNFAACPSTASSNALADQVNLSTVNKEVKTSEQEAAQVVDLLSFDEFDHPAPAVAAPSTAPVQTMHACVQIAGQTCHNSSQVQTHTNYLLAPTSPSQTMTTETNPTPVTPPASTSALVLAPVASPSYGMYGEMQPEKTLVDQFGVGPACPQQSVMCNDFAPVAQPLCQRQYNSYCVQQANAQPGFGYQ